MADPVTTLVYGATGAQGSAIVRRLLADGHAVRALARTGDTRSLEAAGASVVRGDLDDRDTLISATTGCARVVFLLPLAFDVAQAVRWTGNALAAAERAGTELLVFDTSAPVPDAETGVAAVDLKVATERLVRSGPVPAIVVRPTIYMGNLAAPWSAPGIVANRVVAYPLPEDVGVAWISWEDAAAAVVAALGRPDLAGHAFDIGGPELLDGAGLAAAFGRALGGSYGYAAIPLPGFEAGLNTAMGAPVGTEIARLYGWFAGEGRARLRPGPEAARTLGLAPQRLADWVAAQDWTALGPPA